MKRALLFTALFLLAPSAFGQTYYYGGGVPSGTLTMIVTGTCSNGWTEVSGLNGQFLQGTLAANGDVGTTGGNATITPAGTVSQPTFSGASDTTSSVTAGTPAGSNSTAAFTPVGSNGTAAFTPAGTVAAPTFTGASDTTSAVSAGTPAGVNSSTGTVSKLVTSSSGVTLVFVGSALATHTHTVTPTGTNSAPAFSGTPGTVPAQTFTGTPGTVPAETFTGAQLAAHAHTLTPTGTVSQPTFSGASVDPRPQFTKVIFCSKN